MLEIHSKIESLEDFIKILCADQKIGICEAEEILRITGEIKDYAIKKS